jgi:phage/plasmid-associated DNA primase
VGEEDRELPERIHAEKAGILNWALGAVGDTFLRGRYAVGEKSWGYKGQYLDVTSPTAEFFEDFTVEAPGHAILLTDMYWVYLNWYCKPRRQSPLSQARLREIASQRKGIEMKRMRAGYQDPNPGCESRPSQPLCVKGLIFNEGVFERLTAVRKRGA